MLLKRKTRKGMNKPYMVECMPLGIGMISGFSDIKHQLKKLKHMMRLSAVFILVGQLNLGFSELVVDTWQDYTVIDH